MKTYLTIIHLIKTTQENSLSLRAAMHYGAVSPGSNPPAWSSRHIVYVRTLASQVVTGNWLMWVKQCHKPPMTGNGKHSTYWNGDGWGLVYGTVLPTFTLVEKSPFTGIIAWSPRRDPRCDMAWYGLICLQSSTIKVWFLCTDPSVSSNMATCPGMGI